MFNKGQIIGDYTIDEKILKTKEFIIMTAIYAPFNKKVLLKWFPRDKVPQKTIIGELKLYTTIDNIFLHTLLEYFEDQYGYYFVLDYFPGETLMQYTKRVGPIPDYQALHIFVQLVGILYYFHNTLKKVHGCITMDNIHINKEGNIRLINLGMETTSCVVGTENCNVLPFCAPEVVKGETFYSGAIDIWAVGVILYMLVVGRFPFNDANESLIASKIVYEEPYFPTSLPPLVTDLIKHMLIKDSTERVTLTYIMSHKWLSKYPEIDFLFYKLTKEGYSRTNRIAESVIRGLALKGYDEQGMRTAIASKRFNATACAYRIINNDRVLKAFQSKFKMQKRDASAIKRDILSSVPRNPKKMGKKSNFSATTSKIIKPKCFLNALKFSAASNSDKGNLGINTYNTFNSTI